eukprot:501894-Pleurochrysis_carterae.AAC.1
MKDAEDKFLYVPSMAALRMRGASGGGARRPLPLPQAPTRNAQTCLTAGVRGRMRYRVHTINWPYPQNGGYMHFRMMKEGKQ